MLTPIVVAAVALLAAGQVSEHPDAGDMVPPDVEAEMALIAAHDPPEPVATWEPPAAPADVEALHVGSGCSRAGTFTRAELASCFGPWAGLIMCESSGDSTALNPIDTDGLPALGAFQFKQNTWNWAAGDLAGRPDLVGVDPRTLPIDEQHQVAEALRQTQGLGPWGCAWAYGT